MCFEMNFVSKAKRHTVYPGCVNHSMYRFIGRFSKEISRIICTDEFIIDVKRELCVYASIGFMTTYKNQSSMIYFFEYFRVKTKTNNCKRK